MKLWKQMLLAACIAVLGSTVPLLVAALIFASNWGALQARMDAIGTVLGEVKTKLAAFDFGGLRERTAGNIRRLEAHAARLRELEKSEF